jgi:phosphatidylserine decarboxylase
MAESDTTSSRAIPQPLPDNIRGVQPGGGKCHSLELAWGRWRRWYLRAFRRGYVARMAALRRGDAEGAPHEVLDPRDLKFCRNQCDASWAQEDDPFRWRDRIPFARWGLAELLLMGGPLLLATIAAAALPPAPYCYAAVAPGVLLALVVYFFRDPERQVPSASDTWVSPADGKLVEITRLEHDEFIGGPAIRFGIFLSIFNVHINRAPERTRIIKLAYHPGEFLNAVNPASAERNESMWIGMEEEAAPHRRFVVRQISGLIARRIVCDVKPGEVFARGQRFGMIKLGSRTELILPADGFEIDAAIGQKLQAGATVIGRYTG